MAVNRIHFFLLVFILLSYYPQDGKQTREIATTADLTGHWRLHDTQIVQEVPFLNNPRPTPELQDRVSEDSPWDLYTKFDLVFEKDTMYKVHYPIQAFEPLRFSLDTGYLHLNGQSKQLMFPAQLRNDTLQLYTPLAGDPGYFEETYVRTNFEDSILGQMKKYGINYPALAGTWYITREEDYDYGTHYELNFRHTIPDSIEFSREQMIAALHQPKIYWMRTDGVKRDYIFWYQNSRIYLKPGKWYKKDDEMLIRLYQK